MGYLHNLIIHSLLFIERILLQVQGKQGHFALPEAKDDDAIAIPTEQSSLLTDRHGTVSMVQLKDTEDDVTIDSSGRVHGGGIVQTQWTIDLLATLLLLFFPFAAPLHTGLGLGIHDQHQHHARSNNHLQVMKSDPTTCQIINVCLAAFGLILTVDLASTIVYSTGANSVLLLILADVINNVTFAGAILLITLAMRALLTRLYVAEQEITALAKDPQSQPQPQQSNRWLQVYQTVRHDLHSLSHSFGVQLLLSLLVFAIDTTTIIAGVWKEKEHELTATQELFVVLAFCANA
ncbi:expressed unknown protein [Seminavis robusta]|uniref:Uncharacterized protein n=1 Tax=Seminavis robusta TaxID=568900 RepID=A0A9N8DIP7_9STRA|nr:expressed unknown protein [Seminavis robusta]|eukprot:Sro148_g068200.1 n/a (292) ;mRNA; f:76479-77441